MSWLTPEVVDGVCTHMNDDHAEAALAIVRTLGGVPQATAVTTVAVDERSITFRVGAADVVVPFAEPATDRQGVRRAVVELSDRAQAR